MLQATLRFWATVAAMAAAVAAVVTYLAMPAGDPRPPDAFGAI